MPFLAAPELSGNDEVISVEGSIGLVRSVGSVEELHLTDPFEIDSIQALFDAGARLIVRSCAHTDAAVVLGSRQSDQILDLDAVATARLGVVVRRSGGGAVLLTPDDPIWIDLIAPHGWFPDDVHGSMVSAGRLWRSALCRSKVSTTGDPMAHADAADREIEVYQERLVGGPWAELVCFAGRGPGELFVGQRKLVGLSQRRTRSGVRISGAVHRRDLVAATANLMAEPLPPDNPAGAATLGEVGLADLDADELTVSLARCAADLSA